MASGLQILVARPYGSEVPASNYATLDLRNAHAVLDFDASTDEAAYWTAIMPTTYSGGGVTATIAFMCSSATSGNVRWDLAFERWQDETDDLDSDSIATAKSVTAAAPATSGAVQYGTITFTNSEIDGVLAGEAFRIKLSRDADNGSEDTATGDAEVLMVVLRET